MPHEIGEERPPHLVEGGLARFGLHVHPLARRGVAVVQHVVPRQHRVAVDLFVDAQPLHELHPAVEGRIVVCPRAVGTLRPDDHVGVGVVALIVPRILVERRRDDLLSGVGQRLHHGAERLEMGVAPHLRPLDARHGGGMLPQIEVVPPLGGCGKRAAGDLHGQFEPLLVAVAGDRHRRAVESGRSILRHVDGDPYRTHRAGFERHRRPLVEHVGSQHRREILRLALAAAAGEFVAHHVAHETGAHRTFGQPPFIGGQHPCRTDEPLHGLRTPYEQLRRHPLAAPCRQAARRPRLHVRQLRLAEAAIRRHERRAGSIAGRRPVGECGRRIGHFLKIGEGGTVVRTAAGGQQHRCGRKQKGEGTFHRVYRLFLQRYEKSSAEASDSLIMPRRSI